MEAVAIEAKESTEKLAKLLAALEAKGIDINDLLE
jgi:hypothetical protein